APLNVTYRYDQAHQPGKGPASALALARSLGQSRDVIALTWAGRQLPSAGKKVAALGAYRAALAMAARPGLDRSDLPAYLDDSQIRRYALPGEDLIGGVIRDLADARDWTFADWAGL